MITWYSYHSNTILTEFSKVHSIRRIFSFDKSWFLNVLLYFWIFFFFFEKPIKQNSNDNWNSFVFFSNNSLKLLKKLKELSRKIENFMGKWKVEVVIGNLEINKENSEKKKAYKWSKKELIFNKTKIVIQ